MNQLLSRVTFGCKKWMTIEKTKEEDEEEKEEEDDDDDDDDDDGLYS